MKRNCKYLEGCAKYSHSIKVPEDCHIAREDDCLLANQYRDFPDFYESNLKENNDFRILYFPFSLRRKE